jgi:hypothetical protein
MRETCKMGRGDARKCGMRDARTGSDAERENGSDVA